MKAVSPRCSRLRSALGWVLLGAGCNDPPERGSGDTWTGPRGNWVEVFRDDFNGDSGSPPDPSSWNTLVREVNQNQEAQYYTDRRANSFLDGSGHLVIRALRETLGSRSFTSARLDTKGHVEPKYGRIAARMRMPSGKGLWPAFWLLGSSFSSVGWPACGEIDVVEFRGSQPDRAIASIHGPEYFGSTALSRLFELEGSSFADDFHVFSIEWTAEGIRWLVDGQVYHVRTPAGLAELGKTWAFDQPFFVILNLAVGGQFDGEPTNDTPFPSDMVVDYVVVSRLEP